MVTILRKPAARFYLLAAGVLFIATYYSAHAFINVRAEEPRAAAGEPTSIQLWQDLLEGNRRFMRGAIPPRSVLSRREELAKGQHPKIAILGCADSRVAPELIFDKSLGDLFVVRTAGNVADPIALGSLEYAVEHLKVHTLLVLGHEKCGAVAAAASGEKMPTVNLTAIVNKISPALKGMEPVAEPGELATRQVEANIHLCAKNLAAESPVLHHAVETGTLTILKGIYKLTTGEVRKLQ
ncbi:MAG: carbonic anhydrase [Planctomycetota bacterium]